MQESSENSSWIRKLSGWERKSPRHVSLDKNEGVVKQHLACAAHFALQIGGGPKTLRTRIANHISARLIGAVPPAIDTALTSAMILIFEPRFSSGRERPINLSVYPNYGTTSGTSELLSTRTTPG
jgi:hypothetical protein